MLEARADKLQKSIENDMIIHTILPQHRGEVATLIDGDHAAGTFNTTWDASGLPSGVYFYRLTAGEYVQTKKMVLMK